MEDLARHEERRERAPERGVTAMRAAQRAGVREAGLSLARRSSSARGAGAPPANIFSVVRAARQNVVTAGPGRRPEAPRGERASCLSLFSRLGRASEGPPGFACVCGRPGGIENSAQDCVLHTFMHESILANAARLSDDALLARVKALALRERDATVELIAHLAVLDTRRIHLGEGPGSLYKYCHETLGYSEDAA